MSATPIYDSEFTIDEDEQYNSSQGSRADWARDCLRVVMEAATFASVPTQPDITEHHLNEPIRLRPSRATARSAETERQMENITEFVKRKKQLDEHDIYGRLSMISLCIDFADFMWEILQEERQKFDAKRTRPSRAYKKKYGKWDISKVNVTAALDIILQIDPERMLVSDAKRLMGEAHKGRSNRLPGNYDMRREALELWFVLLQHLPSM
jgi:hypothetical protein